MHGLAGGALVGLVVLVVSMDNPAYGSIYFVIIAICGAMWGGFTARLPTLIESRSVGPGLWIQNALRAFVVFGCAVSISVTAVGWFASTFSPGADHGFSIWLGVGLTKGAIAAVGAFVIYGGLDFFQHLHLRAMLSIADILPLRLKAFLRLSDRLNFLTRVGNGFSFIHRELQEYFVSMDDESIARLERS
jgi:hypothetical protein